MFQHISCYYNMGNRVNMYICINKYEIYRYNDEINKFNFIQN